MTLGPDGLLYIADWHDRRTAHPDPDADWDRTNGRIFAIAPPGTKPLSRLDSNLTGKTTEELLGLLNHSNTWYRRRARRLLGERHVTRAALALRDRLARPRSVGPGSDLGAVRLRRIR